MRSKSCIPGDVKKLANMQKKHRKLQYLPSRLLVLTSCAATQPPLTAEAVRDLRHSRLLAPCFEAVTTSSVGRHNASYVRVRVTVSRSGEDVVLSSSTPNSSGSVSTAFTIYVRLVVGLAASQMLSISSLH